MILLDLYLKSYQPNVTTVITHDHCLEMLSFKIEPVFKKQFLAHVMCEEKWINPDID